MEESINSPASIEVDEAFSYYEVGKSCEFVKRRPPTSLVGYDDMLHLAELSVDSLLENVRLRYEKSIFYTYIGDMCVSMNPNRMAMNIYGSDFMELYSGGGSTIKSDQFSTLPPHIFAIASAAYGGDTSVQKNADSCVIITGESGSGKTEASKLMLLFFSHIVKSQFSDGSEESPDNDEMTENPVVEHISSVERILLDSNCILEAFGNAKTARNKNSSRFGKYIQLHFGNAAGNYLTKNFGRSTYPKSSTFSEDEAHFSAVIEGYMLEKSRVIGQQTGERNFHVFYQMLAALDDDEEEKKVNSAVQNMINFFDLSVDPSVYGYFSNAKQLFCRSNNDDRANFFRVLMAMKNIGFSENELKTIFAILAAILHLGNIHFESFEVMKEDKENGEHDKKKNGFIIEDSIRISKKEKMSSSSLHNFCRLLSLDVEKVTACLTSRQIVVNGEVMRKKYRQEEAVHGRNALAKALYERLFYYILGRVNDALDKQQQNQLTSKIAKQYKKKSQRTISLLDLYGFEVLSSCKSHAVNTFEQLLINYCNEKLHQVFVKALLRGRQELYDREEINWRMVAYEDNLPIVKLLDEPARGLFALLDEACLSSAVSSYASTSSTSSSASSLLLEKIIQRFAGHPNFSTRTLRGGNISSGASQKSMFSDFTIRHYAGDVHYTIGEFIAKNMDPLYADYKAAMYSSENGLLKEMWKDGKLSSEPNRLPITAALEFRQSMQQLIGQLSSKRQFFIRCIKPNDDDGHTTSSEFCPTKVRTQIQYLGLVESARVRKAGFISQIRYTDFLQRYRMLYKTDDQTSFDWKQLKLKKNQSGDDEEDERPLYETVCKAIILGENIDDSKVENQEQSTALAKVAFGKTLLFFRDMSIIDCLEDSRDRYLEALVLELQSFARSALAKDRFERLTLARAIIDKWGEIKEVKHLMEVMHALANSDHELHSTIKSADAGLLEYRTLPFLQEMLQEKANPLSSLDRLAAESKSELFNQLKTLTMLSSFPSSHWLEKVLRLHAIKRLWTKKADWGETRRHWLGNYLTLSGSPQKKAFKHFFRKNSAIFGENADGVHFAAYILKTNARNLETVRAIVLTDTALYKVNIDDRSFDYWINLKHLAAITLTPGADQLVVLHVKADFGNDHVFSFYSVSSTTKTNTPQQPLTLAPSDSKVGEFVALLCQQYKTLTKTELPVNISERINFRFNSQRYSVSVKQPLKVSSNSEEDGKVVSPLPHQTSMSSMYKNIWKHLREVFLRLRQNESSSSFASSSELLNKDRINFEFISRRHLEFIYN